MSPKHYISITRQAALSALVIVTVLCASYFLIEPNVGRSQATSTFTISQVITGETSFLVEPSDTTLSGSLNGITGGTANGSTTVVVQSNSPSGYTVTIEFFDNGTGSAMEGEVSGSGSIQDYAATGGEPTYAFSTADPAAVFGYTVTADVDSDLDQSFLDDGASNCNAGGDDTNGVDTCWMEPLTTPFQIIDSDTEATAGATSTLHFRVYVPNNPTPGLVADTYTATATLTVAAQ